MYKPSKEVAIEFDEDKTNYEFPFFREKPSPAQISSFERFCKKMTSQGVSGLLKEYQDNVRNYVNCTKNAFEQNKTKNRYKDVLCADATRVMLPDNGYIHANHVKGPPLYLPLILCQGPLSNTVADFWKMVDMYKVTHIVMLCETVELGLPKCEQYIPKKQGEVMKFPGGIRVEISEQNGVAEVISDATTTTTKILLQGASGSLRKVRHHHFKAWPDKATPAVPDILPLLKILQRCRTNSPENITVIHCSAGIGRTGTLVAIEMCLHQLLGNPQKPLDLLEIAKKLRDQRPGSIQVELQYVMVAASVLEWGRRVGFIKDNQCLLDLEKFVSDYDSRCSATPAKSPAGTPVATPPGTPQKPTGTPPAVIVAPAATSTIGSPIPNEPPPAPLVGFTANETSAVGAPVIVQLKQESVDKTDPLLSPKPVEKTGPLLPARAPIELKREIKTEPLLPVRQAEVIKTAPLLTPKEITPVGLAAPAKLAAPPALIAPPPGPKPGPQAQMMAPVVKK